MSLKDGQRRYKYIGLFSKTDEDFIKSHYEVMTDKEMAFKLDKYTHSVRTFRFSHLKLKKKAYTNLNTSKRELLHELNALIKLDYHGVMKDTYKLRIKQLEKLLNH